MSKQAEPRTRPDVSLARLGPSQTQITSPYSSLLKPVASVSRPENRQHSAIITEAHANSPSSPKDSISQKEILAKSASQNSVDPVETDTDSSATQISNSSPAQIRSTSPNEDSVLYNSTPSSNKSQVSIPDVSLQNSPMEKVFQSPDFHQKGVTK
ncbi:hypothetical protein AVEN_117356-1 [Araneus ventricosus]|uniref:Uncharacterized protein n=1 Tax=Araneus ventricosus TaxID=182803 RepID=A0A4Y2E734_ARAVE|nr:hypothetical protein AVEN_117356-1 [Araneus ventricosus]